MPRANRPLYYGIGRVYLNTRHRVNPYLARIVVNRQVIQRTFPTEAEAIEWIRGVAETATL